jgi:hypothetical protein
MRQLVRGRRRDVIDGLRLLEVGDEAEGRTK